METENRIFWTILENDLKLEIAEHIKNILSFCGLDNALVFKSVSKDDVKYVEKYVQDKAHKIIQHIHSTGNERLSSYFGIYQSDPVNFTFSLREVEFIVNLAHYVKARVDIPTENEGLAHFQILDNVNKENQDPNDLKLIPSNSNGLSKTHEFLYELIATANKNLYRSKYGHRYSEKITSFAAYVRMLSGPMCYETLHENLKLAIPSLSSVNRYIQSANECMVECHLRCLELLKYLQLRNLPLIVSLSEDATRIQGRVQYDSKTNQLLGFVAPINRKTGMPIPFKFPARNFIEILKHFSKPDSEANFTNIMMAKPLSRDAPFCLLMFGSNSKFTSDDVVRRWYFILKELQKLNIRVLTISTDSDPRYNCAMRKCSLLGFENEVFREADWFQCNKSIDTFFVQDPTHIGTKLANFFLKTLKDPTKLPFGEKCFIQAGHIEFLLRNFSKDHHQLTATSLRREDRQDFSFVSRMCDDKVIQLLKDNLSNSTATVKFLEITKKIISSYLDESLSPLERIANIWYAVFVIRFWREFVLRRKDLTLKNNFLTQNCYTCVELNAHSLVFLILHLKENNMSEYFLPWLFDSQICEGFFRLIRSSSTVQSTVVNCTIKECLQRIGKIHLQSEISSMSTFSFPRVKKDKYNVVQELPTKQEIFHTIEKCKMQAKDFAIEIGLIKSQADVSTKCKISPLMIKEISSHQSQDNDNKILAPCIQLKSILLKDFSDKFGSGIVPETSPYVEVKLTGKRKRIVKKTSLVWLLRKDNMKLSSDRVKRVQAPTNPKPKKLKVISSSTSTRRKQKFIRK